MTIREDILIEIEYLRAHCQELELEILRLERELQKYQDKEGSPWRRKPL